LVTGFSRSLQWTQVVSIDVVAQIKKIVGLFDAQLTIDERNLLSVAYKNITNVLRNSWRIVDTLEKMQSMRSPGTTKQLSLMRRQRGRIERELNDVCKDIMLLLDRHLLPAAKPGEESVFYAKM
jgi:14-3-3 protein epsilon